MAHIPSIQGYKKKALNSLSIVATGKASGQPKSVPTSHIKMEPQKSNHKFKSLMSASINPVRVTSSTSPRTKYNDRVIETSKDSESQSPHGLVVKDLTEIPKVASSIPEGDKSFM